MTIRVELQPHVFQDTLDNLIQGSTSDVLGTFKGVPEGGFTKIDGSLTQYSVNSTSFRITTDNVGVKHTIRATLISTDNNFTVASKNRIFEKTVIPVNESFVVAIPLRKGESQIDVFTENDNTFTTVTSSHAGTFLTTYAREIFNNTQNPLDEQTRAIFSKYSSRLPEMLISFQDLYADPKSLRTLISRFVTRAYMTKNGATDGVRDFAAALLGTTPIFVPTKTDETLFEPNVVPVFRRQLEFGGYEAHSWIPNFEIVHWLSFIKLIDATRNYYTIQDIGESEILVLANGIPETHRFDFDDPSASVYSEFNFTDFRVIVEILTNLAIHICAASYPFDLFITAANPLGQLRLTLDSGIPFDFGELWDQAYLDPGEDGWVGFSLTGRFEHYALNANPIQLALDSMFILPAVGSGLPDCVYEGFFTQQLSLFSQTMEAEIDILAELELNGLNVEDAQDAMTWGAEEQNLSLAEFRIDEDLMTFEDIANFSLSGPGVISSESRVSFAGTKSVQVQKTAAGGDLTVTWTNPGAPLDISTVGGNTLYLSAFFGADTLALPNAGVPSYPGKIGSLTVELEDTLGNIAGFVWHKEHLTRGENILPLLLDFPDGQVTGVLDKTDIAIVRFIISSVDSSLLWEELYIGRLYNLLNQAHFRPARAKIELEDIDNVYPQSLYGSQLNFNYADGNSQQFIADDTYNNLPTNAYVPEMYKVKITPGSGTENFDRPVTAANLREELGRQAEILKASVINNLPGEIYVDVFSKEFSAEGTRNQLSFIPDPGNPFPEDLIDITSFAGGSEGEHTRIDGGTGTLSIAQKFTLGADANIRFIELLLHRVGMPGGSVQVSIFTDNSGEPGTLKRRAVDKFALTVPAGIPDYTVFRFTDDVFLVAGDYWIVVSGGPVYDSGNDDENYVLWAKSTVGAALESATTDGNLVGSSFWNVNISDHHFFKVIGE